MALTASIVDSCVLCLGGRYIRKTRVLEAERGRLKTFGVEMRFGNLFPPNVLRICSRSKHKFVERLLEEVEKYGMVQISDQSKLLHKVSALMDNDGVDDFCEDKKSERCANDLKDEAALACKRFPSIILGAAPRVELYEDNLSSSEIGGILPAKSGKGILPPPLPAAWLESDKFSEPWSSLCPELQTVNSSVIEEENSESFPYPELPFENEEESDYLVAVHESSSPEEFELQECDGSIEFLDKPVSCIPDLSKRHRNQLESCGFHTIRKLLHHYPRTYADLQNAQIDIDDGQYLIFVGKIKSSRGVRASWSFSFLEVVVSCEVADVGGNLENEGKKTIYLHLKKFFRGTRFTSLPFLRSLEGKYTVGEIVCVSGKVKIIGSQDHYEMREYNIDILQDENESSLRTKGRPYPIYPSKGGLKPDFLRDVTARALQVLPTDVDPIPRMAIQDFGLPSLRDAYIGIHQPKNFDEADKARRRLIFDEFFYLQLGRLYQMLEGLGTQKEKEGLLDKYRKPKLNAAYVEDWSCLAKKFLKALPYSLTSSQLTAAAEIIWDLKRAVPMNRLLQGDVGCGKTVVAFLACMEVIGCGYQAAFMVPTELLAIQHFEHLNDLLNKMEDVPSKPSIALLTGSTHTRQARMIRQDLQTGVISMVIGTHSLIADSIEFSALRIAVVDEQHRFGVIQRGRFSSKLFNSLISSRMAAVDSGESSKPDVNMAPHVLAMSATPIPRSLALALYGDTSLTQITGMPPGRIPVETHIVEGNETGFEEVYSMIEEELKTGGKTYLVYPVIEQSEQLPQLRAASAELESISHKFPGYNCGLLHGRMKSEDKEEAMKRFRSGETQILLSTQVIEIGVDIPDASMMVVMNAERFGIAQLHQLRGRVGRGERKSKCILVASTPSSVGRLKVLEKSSDGFQLANVDLFLRGPGDLLGKKQSGHLPDFPVARLEIDGNILQDAHVAALKVLGESHDLKKFPALKAELSMRQPLSLLGD